ncbi:3-oxoacyl-[acyl-carrier protein] reductase [Oikeobacillus pervagus]|uniref:3-oxoacyl-[acyl-carrier protein] reductase n=1 Tax=Oikeobacillus pervagus TaxID=1325931 RepID=A0AAJ1WIJ5_9BACI|nr:SDR family oxidoreductase [Oikeobacillus pervagus]MDQ0214408.1 3-oxoacyl-[acyl-carrier protein] reductase [Oikeobacillus pervagus]
MGKKTVLITGGAKGIGKRIAYHLAEQGFNILVNYRTSQKEAEVLVSELESRFGVQAFSVKGDISSPTESEQLMIKCCTFVDGIDILIHNAGPYIKERKKSDDYSIEEWQYIMNGNLNSVFYLTRLALPYMRKKKWGRIITLGFDRVETAPGWIYRSAFAAAKTGVASLTRTIAIEEVNNGITANMVCPGDIIGDWKECKIEDGIKAVDGSTPVGRPGTGEDIARVISFLCSQQSDFITGSIIPVTGGKDVLGKVFRVEE